MNSEQRDKLHALVKQAGDLLAKVDELAEEGISKTAEVVLPGPAMYQLNLKDLSRLVDGN